MSNIHLGLTAQEIVSYGSTIPNLSTATKWSKIGFSSAIYTTEFDLWSYSGTSQTINYPTAAAGMRVYSTHANDTGTYIRSNGTSTGGTTISLIDTGANFSTATAVAVGDIILLDKSGTSPEWGYVTAITSNTELAVAYGFSKGGSGSARNYYIVDQSAATGALVWWIEYLDDAWASHEELGVFNGVGYTATVNSNYYRINGFRVVGAGTGYTTAGACSVRDSGGTVYYTYITVGYTRARNISYTVPAGKTLYVTRWDSSFAYAANTTHWCRLYTKANQFSNPQTGQNMTGRELAASPGIFYAYSETVLQNAPSNIVFESPTKLSQRTTLKVSGIADAATGSLSPIVETVLRGYLTTN